MILTTALHAHIGYGNPYLICNECGNKVTYWHDPARCGCTEEAYNYPCKHENNVTSRCPTWVIVDGCCCSPQCKR